MAGNVRTFRQRRLWLALLATACTAPWHAAGMAGSPGYSLGDRLKPAQPAGGRNAFRQLGWEDLMPPGWDPMKSINMEELRRLPDGDPRARAALEKLRLLWDQAPVRAELDNAQVRLAGFVVPLNAEGRAVREFLLVPYFGACIHAPPPPSNQTVHVVLERPASGVQTMDSVWVHGKMRVTSFDSGMGTAGYRIEGVEIVPYP